MDYSKQITPEQVAMAMKIRKHKPNMGWERIALQLGTTRFKLLSVISPDYMERRKRMVNRARAKRREEFEGFYRHPTAAKSEITYEHRVTPHSVHGSLDRAVAPPFVLEEREYAYSVPQGPFGDPPLGRSALERKMSINRVFELVDA